MDIDTGTYGTKGLPKFGPSSFDSSREGAMTEVTGAFNQLLGVVKKYTAKGNEAALYQFGVHLTNASTWAQNAVAGKPIING